MTNPERDLVAELLALAAGLANGEEDLLNAAAAEIHRLRTAIEEAPHSRRCPNYNEMTGVGSVTAECPYYCWKSSALNGRKM